MRVYFPLLCFYPSQAGGPANTIYWLSEELARSGITSIVTATEHGLDREFSVLDYNKLNEIRFVPRLVDFFRYKEIRKMLESDVVYFSSLFFYPTPFLLLIYYYFGRKSIIIAPRGELFPAAISKSNFKKRVFLKVLGKVQSNISFHVTSPEEFVLVQKTFPKARNVKIIPNYQPIDSLANVENEGYVLFLGRINPIKNLEVAIKALQLLKLERGLALNLNIAGEALLPAEKEYMTMLKVLAADCGVSKQVNFIGKIQGREKHDYLQKALCLVLPSHSENFGNVVVEALSRGTPVIASNNTPWSVLSDLDIGFCGELNPGIIADQIIKLFVLSDIEYERVAQKAHAYVADSFDISKNKSKWVNFFNDMRET